MKKYESVPYEIGEVRRPTPQRHLDYLAMDFESLKRRAVQYLVEQFPEDFNNFSESDYGIFVLELWAFIADHISYKIDYTANQLFLDNTTELDYLYRLAKLTGYHPTPPTPASCWISASLIEPSRWNVIIPGGRLIRVSTAEGPVEFQLYPADPNGQPIFGEDILIPSGSVGNSNILALQGRTFVETKASTGEPNPAYVTIRNGILFNSIEVWVDGQKWRESETLTLGGDPIYTVRYNPLYRARITFGDNVYGLAPPRGSQIRIVYRIGGGPAGNILRGAIQETIPFRAEIDRGLIPVSLTNYTNATGGSSGDNAADIRRKMPIHLRTQERLVTGEDYRNFSEVFTHAYYGKIGKATALLRNFGCVANVIDIYILQDDGGQDLITPTDNLKIELEKAIEDKKMLTDYICIKNGEVVRQNISISVICSKIYIREQSGIDQNIRDRIDLFFRLENWSFGKSLKKGEISRYLAGIPEITSIDIILENNAADLDPDPETIEVLQYQIIRPGRINIGFSFE